ncbi:Malonyl-CoA:anthocyanidin 5-O-glucoside-6''-O-malonyltransferase [Cardamine amara subsp. amara]|uniref:Malonyl-CoA:anthocyanidin 5-O-glucoside-6''-O-malonyltransferase n=1 Tax=Cardamine amara subsp. amara TaxID=228776 RepID=A0ABD0ZII2_CARAN
MTNSAVSILEVVRVNPPPSDSFTLPLTYFDLGWLKLHPVDRVIFYHVPELTRSSLIPKLTSSLSATLLHYLPLAGRLVWDSIDTKPSIVYSPDNKDAVYVTVAESNGDLSYFTGDQPRHTTEFHPLVPELTVFDESARVLAVQITLFPNQGFCLGVSAHHAVLDGKTTAMFLRAWAHNCKQEQKDLPHDLIPFLDRTVVKDPTGIETKLLNRWLSASNNKPSLKLFPSKKIGSDILRVTYRLTQENIKKLRERVETQSVGKQLRLSTFVITYATS